MLSGDVVGGTEQVWLGTVLEDRQDASGLLYRRNRYYSPEQGRFISEDPIGLAGGLNLYGFAEGDPVNYSDPFGLSPGCIPCAWVGILEREGWSGLAKAAGQTLLVAAGVASIFVPGPEDVVVGAAIARFGGGALRASRAAHAAQEGAAAAGKSWTTQRRAFWKTEAASEEALERWGAGNVERMQKGLAPQLRNPRTGQLESVELHHTPVPKRHGGTKVEPVTPDQHKLIDPFRH